MTTKLKVAVLYDHWEEQAPEPEPEPEKPVRKAKTKKKKTAKKKKEKHDREEIFEALEKLGHEPFFHVLDGRTQSLFALAKCGADRTGTFWRRTKRPPRRCSRSTASALRSS
jgi:D-alanine-D-alanine ligase